MASPQVEDGFTRIANELMEAFIRAELPGVQMRIAMIVMRETYGYQRKLVRMGYQAISTKYAIPRTLVIREMAALVDRKVLVKQTDNGSNLWGIQKDYSLWGSHLQVTSQQEETSHQNGQVTSHLQVTPRCHPNRHLTVRETAA
jgi:phage replication O-like protein O